MRISNNETSVLQRDPNRPSRTEFRDDDISRRVESYLTSKHFPCFRTLEVDVTEGIVTISGIVDNYYQRQVAVSSCRRVAGVLQLIDDIDVVLDPLTAQPE